MPSLKRVLRLSYLVRYPALTLLLLMVLPDLYTTSLFRGMTDLGPGGGFLVYCLSFFIAASAVANANLYLLYGELRAQGNEKEIPSTVDALVKITKQHLDTTEEQRQALLASGLNTAASPLVAGVGLIAWLIFAIRTVGGNPNPGHGPLLTAFAAFAFGMVCLWLLTWLQLCKTRPIQIGGVTAAPGPFLVMPYHSLRLASFFKSVYGRPHKTSPRLLRAYKRGLERLDRLGCVGEYVAEFLRDTSRGYLLQTASANFEMAPGHLFGLLLLTMSLILNLVAYWLGDPRVLGPWVPTVAHVLVAMLAGTWILSSLGFFFDRYPFPSTLVIACWALFLGEIQVTDHVYPITMTDSSAILAKRPPGVVFGGGKNRLVVVAAAGGGIQAAGWTATVLNGLDSTFSAFRPAVRTISSVSGGSIGALSFVAGYPALQTTGQSANRDKLTSASMESSLEGVGWGLVHLDLGRLFLPFSRRNGQDRGTVLQESIARHIAQVSDKWKPGCSPDQVELLSGCLEPIPEQMPVLLVNATSSSTGKPWIFSNADLPFTAAAANSGIAGFHESVPGRDAPLASAVRMSATFPYVSPVARAANTASDYLADGGYFDNYGVVALLRFLREANPAAGSEILLILIDSFPEDSGLQESRSMGWTDQLLAPLLTMYNARTSGQQSRARTEIAALGDLLKASVHLETLTFRYQPGRDCDATPPLSWHLTEREQRCIGQAWKSTRANMCAAEVGSFLNNGKNRTPGTAAKKLCLMQHN